MIKVFIAFYRMLTDLAAALFEWLRNPCHVMKALAAILAIVSAVASFTAYKKEQLLNEVRAQLAIIESQCELDVTRLEGKVVTAVDRLTEINLQLEANREELERVHEGNRKALEEARQRANDAEASARAFDQEYDNRPATCSDALLSMAAACPSLRDY